MEKRLVVYFAHGRHIYGTKKSREIFLQIRARYPDATIINPESIPQNSLVFQKCLEAIEKSDIVCITPECEPMYGYTLHRGQASELLFAMSLNKTIQVIYPLINSHFLLR